LRYITGSEKEQDYKTGDKSIFTRINSLCKRTPFTQIWFLPSDNINDISQNLKKMESSIPGVRPGKATVDYLQKTLNRLTFLGALFLAFIAIIPTIIESVTTISTFKGLGATSLLILVGVAIDTAKQIQTYLISKNYENIMK
jgi:preprotein translocase subunit SecY